MDYATPLSIAQGNPNMPTVAQPRPGLPNRTISSGLPNRGISGNAPMSLMQFILSHLMPQSRANLAPLNFFGGQNVGSASMGGSPQTFNFGMGNTKGTFTQQPNRLQATSFRMAPQAGMMPFNSLLMQMMMQPQQLHNQIANYAAQPRVAGAPGFGSSIGSGTATY
jgi:hypothetical protein